MAPGETSEAKAAPEPLYLVQRFVNSVDLETGEDELATPEALRDWFAERGLLGGDGAVGTADLKRAIDVREGLRAVLLQNNGLPLDEELVEGSTARWVARRCGCASARARPRARRELLGRRRRDRALMAMVAAGVESGRWERLKACPREECEWAFYDRSKNSSGRWCSMESCGNIEKARAFRERRRGER